MQDLSRRIKEQAIELGFQKVGICSADEPDHVSALADWLADGNHGTMLWMERTRDKRMDIRKVLTGVKSVLVAGMNYFTPALPASVTGTGRVSRYAHGRDYHELLSERLHLLSEFIRRLRPGTMARAYTDTGPVSEKVWAQKAGLGWQGKHSNLLTQDHSSWLFLGVVLLDLELEYDRPAADHCGTCRRCIELCPTEAITEPYVVDSRRCISYLTIELRGPMPAEWRSHLGDWIYGCDVCQDVCPWNKFARPTAEADFQPLEEVDWANPAGWLAMTRDEFQRLFRHSAMSRAKWAGLLRNVAVALGNSGDARHAGVLLQALQHSEPLVRGHAAWALAQVASEEAIAGLRSALTAEPDPWARSEMQAALSSLVPSQDPGS